MTVITSKQRLPELDGLRGIAILMVIYWHYFAAHVHPDASFIVHLFERVGTLMASGVDLFFVLSGFLIGGILIDNRRAPNLLKAFYARRTFRIFPLYYAVLLIFVVLAPLLKHRVPWLFANPLPLPYYATYTQNIGYAIRDDWGQSRFLSMTWSLAVEEQFYLLLPLLVLAVRPRRLLPILCALIVGAPLFRLFLLFHNHDLAAYCLLPARWDALLLGVCGAMVVRHAPTMARLAANRKAWLYVPFVLMAILFAVRSLKPSLFESRIVQGLQYTVVDIFALWAVLVAVVTPWGAALRWRFLRWIGGISYGVYMFHEGVNGLVHGLLGAGEPQTRTPRDYALTVLSLILSFGVAAFSFRFFESPLLRIGHRFRYGNPEASFPPAHTSPDNPDAPSLA